MKKRVVIAVVALLVAGGALWRLFSSREFLYAGTVEATEVDVSARVSSVIASFDAKEGAVVRAGESLVKLSCEDYRLAADIAQKDFKRAEELRRMGSMPQEGYDRALYKRDDAALRVEWCAVLSPLEGTVLSTYREAGELVNPGAKLLTLADLREVWAMVYVPQTLVHGLRPGMEVEALLPETGAMLKGKVSHINDEAEFTPKNVQTRQERTRLVFGVKIVFPNPEGLLKPGMTVEARLPG
ncbi:MAG: efflux RND transporter periplasmic adaptor subunit [Elusimicrobiota bacterium]